MLAIKAPPTTHMQLHRLVHRAAIERCKKSLKEHPVQWIGGWAGAIALALIYGEDAMMQQAAYSIVATIVFLALAYIRQHVNATVDLYDALKRKNAALESEVDDLKDPGFDVRYSSDDSPCYQKDKKVQADGTVVGYELCRLEITNKNIPQNVIAEVTGIAPCPSHMRGRFPLPLWFQHCQKSVREINLKAGERKYVDVVQRSYQGNSARLTLQHVLDNVVPDLDENQKYQVTVTICGSKRSVPVSLTIYCLHEHLHMLIS